MVRDLYDKHWLPLWQRIGAEGDSEDVFQKVALCYQEPHRAYHGIEHIDFVVSTANQDHVRYLCNNHDAVLLALFLHDVVYDTHANDNEEKSADYAEEILCNARVDKGFIIEVRNLILATKHVDSVRGIDAEVVVDIDLSILGAPSDVFDRYERDIRNEYAWVPEEVFRSVRKGILEKFLKRAEEGTLYFLSESRATWGWQACRNLQRSIHTLS